METSLRSIKNENIRAVFSCVLLNKKVSRAAIAEQIGLSLMTVGKIADSLILSNVLCEEKNISVSAGRRAGLLMPNREKFAAVFEITDEKTNIIFSSVSSDVIYENEHPSTDDMTDILADTAMLILQEYGIENCIGIGIISNDKINGTAAAECARSFFPDLPVVSMARSSASALASAGDSRSDGLQLYISASEKKIQCDIIKNGSNFPNEQSGSTDLGEVILLDNEKLSEKVGRAVSADGYADIIGMCVFNSSLLLSPDTVFVELTNRDDSDGIRKKIDDYLTKHYSGAGLKRPKIVFTDEKKDRSYIGITKKLCYEWLYTVSSGENK